MPSLVWQDKTHLFLGEAIYAHHYVFVDWAAVDANVATALSYQVVFRAAGVDIGDLTVAPVVNGPVVVPLIIPGFGPIDGKIDDLCLKDAAGNVTVAAGAATSIHFAAVGVATVTIPLAAIVAVVPGLGAILGAVAKLFGTKVHLTLGGIQVNLPVERDVAGRISGIDNVDRV